MPASMHGNKAWLCDARGADLKLPCDEACVGRCDKHAQGLAGQGGSELVTRGHSKAPHTTPLLTLRSLSHYTPSHGRQYTRGGRPGLVLVCDTPPGFERQWCWGHGANGAEVFLCMLPF